MNRLSLIPAFLWFVLAMIIFLFAVGPRSWHNSFFFVFGAVMLSSAVRGRKRAAD